MTTNRYRLPRTVTPHRYELTLEPDLEAATFSGYEHVGLTVEEATDEVVLNAAELTLDEAFMIDETGRRLEARPVYEPDTERVRLLLLETAAPGAWTLSVRFRGILNDKLRGFYRSTFKDHEGVERVIATTQFEATDARRAFPCWDEPEFKAVFAVTLVVPSHLLAVSNTREIETVARPDGRTAVRFADTMKMSTYLVAFVVGPLEATEPVDVEGIPLRVVHAPGKRRLAGFALEAGAHFLRWFGDYYGIPYPGDKMDFIAIPDFAFGAMENLGAVTFRENAVLIDTHTARQAEVERVSSVIAHELAHMWFGDLVTMKWWNGVWLNEAFATFMEMIARDAYRPEWKTWLGFAANRGYALDTDALASTRPVEFDVVAPDEADAMFDSLTYQKGSALLRMLQTYLGEDSFRKGVNEYLRTHEYANTESADLWAALERASGEPVGQIMDAWIRQGGFPAVEIATAAEGAGLVAEQARFTYLPDQDAGLWNVPLLVRHGTASGTATAAVLVGAEPVRIDVGEPVEWAVGNAGGNGFYRVRYTRDLLERLLSRLETLDALERYIVLDDAWAFVKAGKLDAGSYLDLARRYENETEAAVWRGLVGTFDRLHRIVRPDGREAFERLVSEILTPVVDRLGWEPAGPEDDLVRKLRGVVLRAIGTTGREPGAIAQARRCVERLFEVPDGVDPDVAVASIYITATAGTDDDYRRFSDAYRTTDNPQDETRFLYSLPEFRREELAEETFRMTLDGRIRTADGPMVVGALIANETTGATAWELTKRHWEQLIEKFPPMIFKRAIETIWTRHEQAADVRAFLDHHQVPQGEKAVAQALERLTIAEGLAARETERLSAYLAGTWQGRNDN